MAATTKREAFYWEKEEGGRVHCLLCPQDCHINNGGLGVCRVRKNIDGTLYSLNYSRVTSANMDPIEKKPLFHFYPGRNILSIGTLGCNLACSFCQNWQISQGEAPTHKLTPEEAVKLALREPENLGIAYTYNEPFIWFEYVEETAQLIHAEKLKNVLVTNGYVNEKPLRELLPYIDAMNVDIKSMRPEFYRELCKAKEGPAKRTVKMAHGECHVEVTTLLIPGWNDSDEEIRGLVDWLAGVDPEIPLHFSRYHPAYKMTEPSTPAETLYRARQIAGEKLAYVYLGNMAGEGIEDTVCPQCGETIVKREGFYLEEFKVKNGKCGLCGRKINMVS